MKLNIGNIVRSTNSLVKMTIKFIQDDKVICNWFENETLHEKEFNYKDLIFISQ